jgi:hypothetical protein
MNTYSASHQVNGPGHLLNGRLGGYCQGLVPWVISYAPANLDMALFPLVTNGWGTKYPIQYMVPLLLAEGEGLPT